RAWHHGGARLRVETATRRPHEWAVPVVAAAHGREREILVAELFLNERSRVDRLEKVFEGLLVRAGAGDFEAGPGERSPEAPLFLRLRDEPLTAGDEDGRPPLAHLPLPGRLGFGRHDPSGNVVHRLVALWAHVEEAIDAVAEGPEGRTDLIHDVDAQRALDRQRGERLVCRVQAADEMLRVLPVGALHVLAHGSERGHAERISCSGTVACAGWRRRSPG